jgi:hypothetical protein
MEDTKKVSPVRFGKISAIFVISIAVVLGGMIAFQMR